MVYSPLQKLWCATRALSSQCSPPKKEFYSRFTNTWPVEFYQPNIFSTGRVKTILFHPPIYHVYRRGTWSHIFYTLFVPQVRIRGSGWSIAVTWAGNISGVFPPNASDHNVRPQNVSGWKCGRMRNTIVAWNWLKKAPFVIKFFFLCNTFSNDQVLSSHLKFRSTEIQ